MKKLYVLLSYALCLSSTFATGKISSDFDDCDEKISPRNKGCVEPHTTPQTGPQPGKEVDSLMQLFLPEVTQAPIVGGVDSSEVAQNTPKAETFARKEDCSLKELSFPMAEHGNRSKEKDELTRLSTLDGLVIPSDSVDVIRATPDLKIYYSEPDGEGTSLKRFTVEMLKADYAELSPGEVFEAKFMPEIILQDATRTRVDQLGSKSVFDTIGWLANVRAWVKWYLNPWAWWNPSAYSLDANGDSVEWDRVSSQATIRLTTGKDATYLASQLKLFLLKGWGVKFAPDIAPATQKMLERAVMSRFENIEKPALKAVGFKDVTLGTWVNPRTQRLERVIRALK